MALKLDITVTDAETGAVVASSSEASFPWHGATWIVPEDFDEALANFLMRHMANVARDVAHYMGEHDIGRYGRAVQANPRFVNKSGL